jgi:hypothetical protein
MNISEGRGDTVRILLAVAAALLAGQAVALLLMGQPPICDCGRVDLWHGDPSGPETSQHLTDWYTLTHVVHGFGFYALLWLLVPRLSFGVRLLLALGLEVGWEILENTPMIIERYREQALAEGYFGDSVVNSIGDTLATVIGFVAARALPVWSSVVLVIAIEVFAALMIRDNLALNVIQLILPIEAVSRWQLGG